MQLLVEIGLFGVAMAAIGTVIAFVVWYLRGGTRPATVGQTDEHGFTDVYNQDGTCYACGKPGIVLGYSNRRAMALWCCISCWPLYRNYLVIVQDLREQKEEQSS